MTTKIEGTKCFVPYGDQSMKNHRTKDGMNGQQAAAARRRKRPRTAATALTVTASVLLAAYFGTSISLIRHQGDVVVLPPKERGQALGTTTRAVKQHSVHANPMEQHSDDDAPLEQRRAGSTTAEESVTTNAPDHTLAKNEVEETNPPPTAPADDVGGCSEMEADYKRILDSLSSQKSTSSSSAFSFDRAQAEAFLQQHGSDYLHQVISAYVEGPLNDTVPETGSRGDLDSKHDLGTPPEFYIPLPTRTQTPSDLTRYEYPRVQTCHDMPGKFPVDRGLEIDSNGKAVVWNVGNSPMPDDFALQEAPYCPVEADPFLPWIHDVFPSQDGSRIEFIAQNKRRCRTGSKFTHEVNRLVPQVALMQSVSVERIDETRARALAPELWQQHADNSNHSATTTAPRYRLAPLEEASPDGMYTRFICRFHVLDYSSKLSSSSDRAQTVVIGETLSEFPFNYDFVAYRKGKPTTTLITPKGKDSRLFWASNIRFHCPLPPDDASLRAHVATGHTVLSNGSPTLFVDLIPIRTSVRYSELHMTDDLVGPRRSLPSFNATLRWGNRNVLPPVEASGRWTNIPICKPPKFRNSTCSNGDVLVPNITQQRAQKMKPHVLSACLWASAEFKTRGVTRGADSDTQRRLEEWIEFHLTVGFDHIYLYDNSGAHTNATSLASVVDLYPGKITRIDWPSMVCNNNIPAHDSTGERSSQYAAENSCRTRYGAFTEWIAAFDTDEYLVPMGNYTSLKEVLADATKAGTNILSFRSSRGRLRVDKSDAVGNAREQSANATFLEAYNCDSAGTPKPEWSDRARKQVYRTSYVLYHYVHYSTVTKGYLTTYQEEGKRWRRNFGERPPSERVTDEANEAVMIHTKSLKADMTARYKTRCRHDWQKKWQGCWVAVPYPSNVSATDVHKPEYDIDGMEYNCYINERVDNYWVPKLREAMKVRRQSWANIKMSGGLKENSNS